LQSLARETGYPEDVIFTGSVPWAELPSHYTAGNVFAMPCRTRRGGLDVEGLGIVYLEASASGLPVVAGDSGGAPDAVLEGETGFVIPNDEGALVAIVDRLVVLLADPTMRNRLARAGRDWVKDAWSWERQVSTLQTLV
jgi:phosphatidylinositol alpha-1,6-mannosyltransferase